MDNSADKILCPVCGCKDLKIIGKPVVDEKASAFIKLAYLVVQCKLCKYYFVTPQIDFSQNEWQKLYDEGYFPQMTGWHKKHRAIDVQNRLRWLSKSYNRKVENFLDVGCGEGLTLAEAFNMHWKATGIDISDNRNNFAKNDQIHFIKGNLLDAALQDAYFDCAYMDSVLEHLTDPVKYMKELNRIIKAGGVLYIGVPNEDSLFNLIKRFVFILTGKKNISAKIKPFALPYHVGGFNKNSLVKIAEVSGFKVISLRNFAARFEFLKYKPLSKGFWLHLLLLPVDTAAIFIRKEAYYEAILTK